MTTRLTLDQAATKLARLTTNYLLSLPPAKRRKVLLAMNKLEALCKKREARKRRGHQP